MEVLFVRCDANSPPKLVRRKHKKGGVCALSAHERDNHNPFPFLPYYPPAVIISDQRKDKKERKNPSVASTMDRFFNFPNLTLPSFRSMSKRDIEEGDIPQDHKKKTRIP